MAETPAPESSHHEPGTPVGVLPVSPDLIDLGRDAQLVISIEDSQP